MCLPSPTCTPRSAQEPSVDLVRVDGPPDDHHRRPRTRCGWSQSTGSQERDRTLSLGRSTLLSGAESGEGQPSNEASGTEWNLGGPRLRPDPTPRRSSAPKETQKGRGEGCHLSKDEGSRVGLGKRGRPGSGRNGSQHRSPSARGSTQSQRCRLWSHPSLRLKVLRKILFQA